MKWQSGYALFVFTSRVTCVLAKVRGSTIGQTHPVEEVYSARRNIAADAARKGKPSVDNCALLLTSDDWLRSLADMRDRPGTVDYQIDFAAILIMAEASRTPRSVVPAPISVIIKIPKTIHFYSKDDY